MANLHFAPTQRARENLLSEGVDEKRIFVTGNTVVDALFATIDKINLNSDILETLKEKFSYLRSDRRNILVTCHRRENFGEGFENIFLAMKDIIKSNQAVDIIFPIHMNPSVREPAFRILHDEIKSKRIHLIEPQDYISFVYLMKSVDLVLTDSGGVQEEAPSFGVPVLVTRDVTERPEALESGLVFLVGSNRDKILTSVFKMLENKKQNTAEYINPFGNGTAAFQIVNILKKVGSANE